MYVTLDGCSYGFSYFFWLLLPSTFHMDLRVFPLSPLHHQLMLLLPKHSFGEERLIYTSYARTKVLDIESRCYVITITSTKYFGVPKKPQGFLRCDAGFLRVFVETWCHCLPNSDTIPKWAYYYYLNGSTTTAIANYYQILSSTKNTMHHKRKLWIFLTGISPFRLLVT